ncbi:winged helix-turn-helix transcriptional regulator [Umezawaea tangerina]|uniref:HxlR family transcriptional regulator n=1 Tax=Umezawaea tangerina TaxID=84725 RepID=A0A2T0STT8_9PSEU|nr:helix-turn-helix domain-containing protein [Umezawaea tangerina]PRY36825.1 HxlR family transcriptional regulator [Umezawaea tangerina]
MVEGDVTAVAVGARDCGDLPVENGEFVRQVLTRIGDKWTLLVVANLEDGPRRYSDLRQAVPGISQRMLTLTLRQLGEDGLVSRTSYGEVPPRVEYALTPLGGSLLETAAALVRWASTHHTEIRENRSRAAARSERD